MIRPKLNDLVFSGYVNGEPALVFHIDDNTNTMWIFPTEYSFEFLRDLAEGYRRN